MAGSRLLSFLSSKRDSEVLEVVRRLALPLQPASGFVVESWLRFRARNPRSLPRPVISVGNITAGGTGKTSFVGLLLGMLEKRGLRTAVLSRGYGRRTEGLVSVGPEESSISSHWTAGDEPCMVAGWSRNAKVFVHRDRYRAGVAAFEDCSPAVFLLDDGFQHVSLRRDLDVVLLDCSDPFDNGMLLPFGLLREPMSSLRRANLIVMTRCNQSDTADSIEAVVRQVAPGVPTARAVHVATSLVDVRGSVLPVEELENRPVFAFSGIGNNASFLLSALDAGAEPRGSETFADHYPYSPDDLERMMARARDAGAEWLLTTEKDMVRIRREAPSMPLYALTVRMALTSGAEHLESELDRILAAAADKIM